MKGSNPKFKMLTIQILTFNKKHYNGSREWDVSEVKLPKN